MNINQIFSGECNFLAGANNVGAIPQYQLPEIAFVGRSNVGKSSLINALTNRKTLARISHTPGRTRQLNFFSLVNKIILVDLPGYGYAKISQTHQYEWSKLIHHYLTKRNNLQRVFILIDSRRELRDTDKMLMDILDEFGISYQIILTKADQISREDTSNKIAEILANTSANAALYPEIIVTSSRNKEGVEKLRKEIAKFCK